MKTGIGKWQISEITRVDFLSGTLVVAGSSMLSFGAPGRDVLAVLEQPDLMISNAVSAVARGLMDTRETQESRGRSKSTWMIGAHRS